MQGTPEQRGSQPGHGNFRVKVSIVGNSRNVYRLRDRETKGQGAGRNVSSKHLPNPENLHQL